MKQADALELGARGFEAAYGLRPEGTYLAPGRVNIIGEHTDYQEGLCLPLAIDRHTVVAARRRTDRLITAYSETVGEKAQADLDSPAGPPSAHWFRYVRGVVAGLRSPGGLDLFISGDLAVGAGVSSSASLEMAVATAINDLFSLGRSPQELALVGQRAENTYVGVPTGIMDQFAVALGQEGKALLLDVRDQSVVPVPFAPERDGIVLGVVDTRAQRSVAAGEYQSRFDQAAAAAAALGLPSLRSATPAGLAALTDPVLARRARHIVSENSRVLAVVEAAGCGQWAAVGEALYASHRSLAEDYEVSHPALDLVVETALATEGVFGARLTGAGFGGSAIVLMEALAEQDLLAGLRAGYAARGWAPFAYMAVRASAGAGPVAQALAWGASS